MVGDAGRNIVPMKRPVNKAAMNEARPVNPKNATVVGVKILSAKRPGAIVPVRKRISVKPATE